MRWLRALRLLEAPAGAWVLDLGCAFGFGTRILARRYVATGLDGSPTFIARAPGMAPRANFVLGVLEHLPFNDRAFDAIVCLEVIEHLADEAAAVAEMWRALKPGGELVLSVPHAGALQHWDSLNRYLMRTGRPLALPPGELPSGSRWHRHYSLPELRRLLVDFRIDRVELTGIGLAEIVHGLLLYLPPRFYEKLQFIYYGLAVLEDDLPMGRHAYNVTIHARKGV